MMGLRQPARRKPQTLPRSPRPGNLPVLRIERPGPELHQAPRCPVQKVLFRTIWIAREGQEVEAGEEVTGRDRGSWGRGPEGLRPYLYFGRATARGLSVRPFDFRTFSRRRQSREDI